MQKIICLIMLCFLSFLTKAQNTFFVNTVIETTYKVRQVNSLNTADKEFSPYIYNNQIIFISDREFDYLEWGENRWKKRKYVNIYTANYNQVSDSILVSDDVNFYDKSLIYINHTGPLVINKEGNEIIFTRVDKKSGKLNKPQLYISKKRGNSWSKPQKLSFVNDEYSFGHPYYSDDEQYLFFASDMPGSMGGKDIFYCKRNSSGWDAPINCGNKVNTEKDEIFPSFKNSYLYFASNREGGFGNLDLYKTKFINDNFSKAENLGNTINSESDDFAITFTADMKYGLFSSNRLNGKGSDDIYYINIYERAIVTSKDIVGNFTYKKLGEIASGVEVKLLDDNGNLVGITLTDEKGDFAFRNLEVDKNYNIKALEEKDDILMKIYDRNGNVLAMLVNDVHGSFLYKKLEPVFSSTLSLMDEDDKEKGIGHVSGQFIYEKLPDIYPNGMEVFLVDDNGKIMQKTKTDKHGNFSFKNLPTDAGYSIKTNENEDDLILLAYNNSNNVIAELKRNPQGEYMYRKLLSDYNDVMMLIEEKDEKIIDKKHITLAGYFTFKNSKQDVANLEFSVVDEQGNVLAKSKTNEAGYYRVKGLPLMDKYIFQMNEDDPISKKRLYLHILNRSGEALALLENDNRGRFTYRRLIEEYTELSEIEIKDESSLTFGLPKIHFDKNSSMISIEYQLQLDLIRNNMLKNPNLKLKISGHTDLRDTEGYNMYLSKRRAEAVKSYLILKGVHATRIITEYKGETMPVNNCKGNYDCPEDKHRENRRCELMYISNL